MEKYMEWYIKVPHFWCLEYYEGDKKMIVELDFRDLISYLKPQMIKHWETPYVDVEITKEDKRRILQNIKQYLLSIGTEPSHIVVEETNDD